MIGSEIIQTYFQKYGLSSDEYIRVMEGRDDRIWISNMTTGIDVLDPSAKKIKRLETELAPGSRDIQSLRETLDGDIYAGGLHIEHRHL